MRPGDTVWVACESWAGRTYHRVVIEKLCPKRIKVRWDDATAFSGQRQHGASYYVPRHAVRAELPSG